MYILLLIRKYMVVLILTGFICLCTFLCKRNLADDLNNLDEIVDPSSIAVDGERFRIIGDFNFDGLEDMALSEVFINCGQAGCNFTLYLADSAGNYNKYDDFFGWPGGTCLEKFGKKVRLWQYHHVSAQEGMLGYCEITDMGFSECQGIFIFPGDAGTKMGAAILSAVSDNCEGDLKVQRSITTDGVVEWVDDQK